MARHRGPATFPVNVLVRFAKLLLASQQCLIIFLPGEAPSTCSSTSSNWAPNNAQVIPVWPLYVPKVPAQMKCYKMFSQALLFKWQQPLPGWPGGGSQVALTETKIAQPQVISAPCLKTSHGRSGPFISIYQNPIDYWSLHFPPIKSLLTMSSCK